MSGRFNLADYVTVDERIDKFWEAHRADGSIQTEVCWVADDGSSVAIRASVYLGPRLIATGIAQEERGPGGANRTSWWENAETSAIGRALANYGMSLSKQRPSREEMAKVERYDEQPPAPPPPARTPAPSQTRQNAPGATKASMQVQSATTPPPDAAQAELPAAPPLTDAGYKTLFEQAWTMVEDGSRYLDIVAFVKRNRDRMTDAQFEQSRDEVRLIRKAIEERDKAATPASYAG